MKPQLKAKLQELRSARAFNANQWIDRKCEMLNEYMRRAGLKACVINVSGGIDSALTIMLAHKAMELQNSPIKKVLGIVQPIHSTDSIMKRATDFLDASQLEYVVIDQSKVFDLLDSTVEDKLNMNIPEFAKGQLKSYMRTPVAYFAAQALAGNGLPAIVLGTGNYDEDGYLYYFCKPGDGTSDVQLIHDLHKSEVNAAARAIGVTTEICDAAPSADLWPGQTDENELGFSYEYAELYIDLLHDKAGTAAWLKTLDHESRQQWDSVAEKIEKTHRRNSHKEKWPINLDLICPTGQQYSF